MTARGGFALVAVLWLITLFSAVGLELGILARERRIAAANLIETVHADAAAAAGVEHARALVEPLALLEEQGVPASPDELMMAGRDLSDSMMVGAAAYRLTLADAGAKLNINNAGEDELRRLLAALRLDAGAADRVAQAILDWRDADDLSRARGAERADYEHDGANVLPRNAPFRHIDELRNVRGVTQAVYRTVAEHVTVVGSGRVNLNAAPRVVLLSQPGIGEEAADILLQERASGRPVRNLNELSALLSVAARAELVAETPRLLTRTTFDTREIEVMSEGWLAGSHLRTRIHAIFLLSGGTAWLAWRTAE